MNLLLLDTLALWHMEKQRRRRKRGKKTRRRLFLILCHCSFICTSNHLPFTSNVRCFVYPKMKKRAFNIRDIRGIFALHGVIASILHSDNAISMFGGWICVCSAIDRRKTKGRWRKQKKIHTRKRVNATKNVQIFVFTCGFYAPPAHYHLQFRHQYIGSHHQGWNWLMCGRISWVWYDYWGADIWIRYYRILAFFSFFHFIRFCLWLANGEHSNESISLIQWIHALDK